mmetsp:Transcript_10995/g.25542  ORF Transcript_10995/g.25542 Transcript_10995/m.25542 type:complete len:164 (+) Transcript_10995:1-492(+)
MDMRTMEASAVMGSMARSYRRSLDKVPQPVRGRRAGTVSNSPGGTSSRELSSDAKSTFPSDHVSTPDRLGLSVAVGVDPRVMSQSGVPLNSTPIQGRPPSGVAASRMKVAGEAASADAAMHVPNPTRTARPLDSAMSGVNFTKERTDAAGPRLLAQGQGRSTY